MEQLLIFNELASAISEYLQPIEGLTVDNPASNDTARGCLLHIKSFANQIEAKRKDLIKPLKEKVEYINSYAKEIELPLLNAEKTIKSQMLAWSQAERERIAKEQERLDQERREMLKKAEEEKKAREAELKKQQEAVKIFGVELKVDKAQEVIEAAKVQATNQALQQEILQTRAEAPKNVRTNWKFEVLEMGKLPEEFVQRIPDMQKIRSAITMGVREIPGVEIWPESTIVAR